MSTREKYTPDEALGARLLAELNGLPPAVDVDAAVRGARRQRRVDIGLVAGGAATVVAALTLGAAMFAPKALDSALSPILPAGPSVMSGCTLEPTSCDSQVVDTWAEETIAGGKVTVETPPFANPEFAGDAGTTRGEQNTSLNILGPKPGSSKGQIMGELSVGVARSVDEDLLVKLMRGEGPVAKDRTTTFTVDGQEVTARVLRMGRGEPGEIDDLWIIRESETHGAIVMSVWSRGAGTNLSPTDGSGPGWTDASAQDLVGRLLTEPVPPRRPPVPTDPKALGRQC